MHVPALWQGHSQKLRGEVFTLKGPSALPGCGDFCFVWTGSVAELYTALENADAPIITKSDDPLITTDSGAVARAGGRQEGTQVGTSVCLLQGILRNSQYMCHEIHQFTTVLGSIL